MENRIEKVQEIDLEQMENVSGGRGNTQERDNYTCGDCGATFSTFFQLMAHRRTVHEEAYTR